MVKPQNTNAGGLLWFIIGKTFDGWCKASKYKWLIVVY
jgi:hypothetical protein